MRPPGRRTRPEADILVFFLRAYPGRTVALVLLLLLAGLVEGVGVATILPVIRVVGGEPAIGASALLRGVSGLLGAFRISLTLGALLWVVVAAVATKALLRWLAMRQVGYSVSHVAADLRSDLVRAVLAARWSYLVRESAGGLAQTLTRDAFWAAFTYRKACTALAAAIEATVYAALAMLVSWRVAMAALVLGGALAYVLGRFVGMSRRAGDDQTEGLGALAGRFTESMQTMKAVRGMAAEKPLRRSLEATVAGLARADEREVVASEAVRSIQEPVLAMAVAAGLWVAVTRGSQPLSALLVLAFLFQRILGRLHLLQREYQTMAASGSAFRSVRRATLAAEGARETSGAAAAPPLDAALRIHRVTVVQGEERHHALSDVDIEVRARSFVVVRGPSGAGKTTLLDLVLGLYRPDTGDVTVDGVSLGDIDLASWRRRVGYVPQENTLVHDTVAMNVSMGDEELGVREVEEALRRAGAWEVVARLPRGVETVLGERGETISGGERQRIALARALVRRPTLLVLDEPTAHVDAALEAALCRTLRSLAGEMTVLAASHGSALAAAADRVVLLQGGRIVDVADVRSGEPGT